MAGARSDDAETSWGPAETSWGPAEAAAIDRCLAVPGLACPSVALRSSPQLVRTIEAEIIPRLLLAHLEKPRRPGAETHAFSPPDIVAFARVVVEPSRDETLAFIGRLRMDGHSYQAILLDLLAPTARLLGEMWNEDLCSFTDVTIGLSRLQQVLRAVGSSFEKEIGSEPRGTILLATMPGEQHSFGLSMLESFFRRAGWSVIGGSARSSAELRRLAKTEWCDVIGVSLSSEVMYDPMRDLLASLRKASRNRSPLVLVGGHYFTNRPEHAIAIGADAMANDALDALRLADSALRTRLARC